MRRIFLIVVALVVATSILGGVVVAQDDLNDSDDLVDDQDELDCTERITPAVRLCDADLEDQTAILILESDRPVTVTLSDSSAYVLGGDANLQTRRINGQTTVRYPVNIVSGVGGMRAGVGVTQGGHGYGIVLDRDNPLFGPPWTHEDAIAAALGGASGVTIMAGYIVLQAARGRSDETERIG